ncbi:Copia type Polyprotein [Phytophthora megakarya]|uniref:Copia type Polyprotein n=1 Tax=Phytophthora megakarya TaxID=4795 RepID=A0A225UXS7_9STRA|nr:Copia type Polyprotein [Phytophthora megakarya]
MYFASAKNNFLEGLSNEKQPDIYVNFTLHDGVAKLQRWHERLAHTCPQHVLIMSDRSLVEGLTLESRTFQDCEACHLGKQKAKPLSRSFDRDIKHKNQVVFADLLFPETENGTSYSAVLVIIDAFTRYITAYPIKTKGAGIVNALMKRYVSWSDRQHRDYPVREIITDNGPEFYNTEIDAWYKLNGIQRGPFPPRSSHLNLCERSHQTLTGMMKTMMSDSGLPGSFWVDAISTAVYIKNRVFTRALEMTPYEAMWGRRPDLHHLRRFGCLAYAHNKVGPSRKKFAPNCKVGFVLGYQEGRLGCKMYYPSQIVKLDSCSDTKKAV